MKGYFIKLMLAVVFNLSALNTCLAQVSCETSLNNITNLYKNGEWDACKDSSLHFISSLSSQDGNKFSSKLSPYCKNNIYQVYFYLVKSYLRLYDPDHAKIYYFEALKNEFNIDF